MNQPMDRRNFIKDLAISCAGGTLAVNTALGAKTFSPIVADDINASRIPRWRGFNLQGRFAGPGRTQSGPAFDEFDFATMAEWRLDRKSTRLNSSHITISYAV